MEDILPKLDYSRNYLTRHLNQPEAPIIYLNLEKTTSGRFKILQKFARMKAYTY